MMTSVAIDAMYSRERYAALLALAESLEHGASVYDERGTELYRNAALDRLLAAEPEREQLERAMEHARRAALEQLAAVVSIDRARSPGPGTRLELRVRTERSEYRVDGCAVEARSSNRATLVVMTIRTYAIPRRLSAEELEARYGLTRTEARVAALIDAGRRSREIAEELRISVHTARRHAEAVLKKLGVHSRAEVATRLRE